MVGTGSQGVGHSDVSTRRSFDSESLRSIVPSALKSVPGTQVWRGGGPRGRRGWEGSRREGVRSLHTRRTYVSRHPPRGGGLVSRDRTGVDSRGGRNGTGDGTGPVVRVMGDPLPDRVELVLPSSPVSRVSGAESRLTKTRWWVSKSRRVWTGEMGEHGGTVVDGGDGYGRRRRAWTAEKGVDGGDGFER